MLSWSHEQWKDFGIGCFWTLASFVFFRLLQFVVRWYLFGKCTFRTFSYFNFRRTRRATDPDVTDSTKLSVVPPNKKWRICNEAVSLIHSVVSGLWAAYALLFYKSLISDMMNYNCDVGVNLLYLSAGYLLHDLCDLLINERSVRIIELLFHHFIVLLAFTITLSTGKFLGVVICGLLMEVNSIFLHSRSLLNLYGTNKKSPQFRMVALFNMVTLIVFRMAVSVYLFYWQVTELPALRWYVQVPCYIVITSLCTTNTVLAYRVMAADGLFGAKRARRNANPGAAEADVSSSDEDEEDGAPVEEVSRKKAASARTTSQRPTAVVVSADGVAVKEAQAERKSDETS